MSAKARSDNTGRKYGIARARRFAARLELLRGRKQKRKRQTERQARARNARFAKSGGHTR